MNKFADSNMNEQVEATLNWLENASHEELEDFAVWLVENGYGVEE